MNRLTSDIEPASIALAAVVLLVAALLGYRERHDRRGRPDEQTGDDRDHLARRDRRRSWGLSILCLLALGVLVGSRTPPRLGIGPNPWFLAIWFGIFALIISLLALALVDWFDLRTYARRKKSAIGREQLAILQTELDQWKSRADGRADGREAHP